MTLNDTDVLRQAFILSPPENAVFPTFIVADHFDLGGLDSLQ
ncbi:hypothetical protein [Sphingobium aromaticiconvertens]